MRLTFVINSLAAGGAQRVITDLMARLFERGHTISLVTYSKKERDHFKVPLGVARVELNLLWDSRNPLHALQSNVQRLRVLRSAVVQSKPDAVVSFIDLTNVMTLISLCGSGIPIVISERIHPEHYPIGWQWNIARRLTYFLCSSLVVQTRDIANWARGYVPSKKIAIIPNAAPRPTGPASHEGRQKVLLCVGRLNAQKGFDLLLPAFAKSGIWRDGWRLVILGEGPERGQLTRLARELGITECLDLPGEVEDVAAWYRSCGLFVLPSRYEGFPNVLLEAMSHGCPSIAFDCPSGPRDIVEDGKNGVLVPAADVVRLTAAIEVLAADDRLRDRMGRAAADVQSRFSQAAVTQRWEDVLTRVASAR